MRAKILVVDDFTSVRQHVCDILEKKEYQTFGVTNGIEALRALTQNPHEFDLVITDYNMPIYNGIELLKKIKSTTAIRHIPVIFLTTDMDPEKMKQAKAKGLFAWIIKPYRLDTFLAQINRAVSNGNKVSGIEEHPD